MIGTFQSKLLSAERHSPMAEDPLHEVTFYRGCIQRLNNGDRSALDELLRRSEDRLTLLTRKMLRDFPSVKRWEQTNDVLQVALMKMIRALSEATPNDERHFLRLCALQIRRVLVDLARHYKNERRMQVEPFALGDDPDRPRGAPEPAAPSSGSSSLADWGDFHEAVNLLPDDERETFELLWYHGLSQLEAAELLQVDERTVRRRWTKARLILSDRLKGDTKALKPESS